MTVFSIRITLETVSLKFTRGTCHSLLAIQDPYESRGQPHFLGPSESFSLQYKCTYEGKEKLGGLYLGILICRSSRRRTYHS